VVFNFTYSVFEEQLINADGKEPLGKSAAKQNKQ